MTAELSISREREQKRPEMVGGTLYGDGFRSSLAYARWAITLRHSAAAGQFGRVAPRPSIGV